ncbi:MAG: hypothetical protein AAGK02_02600 [Pseudomonadota bacterium]
MTKLSKSHYEQASQLIDRMQFGSCGIEIRIRHFLPIILEKKYTEAYIEYLKQLHESADGESPLSMEMFCERLIETDRALHIVSDAVRETVLIVVSEPLAKRYEPEIAAQSAGVPASTYLIASGAVGLSIGGATASFGGGAVGLVIGVTFGFVLWWQLRKNGQDGNAR